MKHHYQAMHIFPILIQRVLFQKALLVQPQSQVRVQRIHSLLNHLVLHQSVLMFIPLPLKNQVATNLSLFEDKSDNEILSDSDDEFLYDDKSSFLLKIFEILLMRLMARCMQNGVVNFIWI